MHSRFRVSPFFRRMIGWTCVAVGVFLAIPLVPGPGIPLILIGLGLLGKGGKYVERLKATIARKVKRRGDG